MSFNKFMPVFAVEYSNWIQNSAYETPYYVVEESLVARSALLSASVGAVKYHLKNLNDHYN